MTIVQLTATASIGAACMSFLAHENILFTLRLRENQYESRRGYAIWTLARHTQGLKRGSKRRLMAVAATLVAKTGASAERERPIPVTTHRRKAVSLLGLGLATSSTVCTFF